MKKYTSRIGSIAVVSGIVAAQLFFFSSAHAATLLHPALTSTATQSSPLSSVSLSGTGFAANENVRITFGLSTTNVTADNTGSFTNASITVPTVASGTHIITAVGLTSGAPAYDSLYVSTFNPQISPSTFYTFPGSSLTISGTGFAPNEGVTITGVNGVVASSTTNASGSFTSSTIVIPFSASGSVTYTAKGISSDTAINTTITLGTVTPYLSADAYSGNPGDVIHIQGFNFGGGEQVTFTGGSFSTTTTANASGTTPAVAFTLPFRPSSLLHITLTGGSTHTSTSLDAWIGGASASVSPSTYYVAPGSTITFTGSGFAPNEQVNVNFDNASSTSVTADAKGGFIKPLTIPLSAKTAHYVFTGSNSGQNSTVDITLAQFYAGIQLSTYWAQAGSPEVITGAGFGSNESVLLSSKNGVFATTTADSTGAFSWNGTVPFAPSGATTFTATGALTGATATSPFTIAPVYTGVSLNNYAGKPGTVITVTGSGYLANEQINITGDRSGTTVLGTVTSDASGNVNGSFTVPTVSEGNLVLTFTSTHSFDQKSITMYVQGQ